MIMKHRILLPLSLLALIAILVGGSDIFSHINHQKISQTASVAESQNAVETAFQSQPGAQAETLSTTVISGNYAVQLWSDTNEGGEALLTYDASADQWNLVTWGGGAWDVDGLVAVGVDQTDAQNLVALLPQ